MKIGIVTFHWSKNYGAALQAFALKNRLELMGHYVEIIDYRPKYIKRKETLESKIKDFIIKVLSFNKIKDKNNFLKRFNEFEDNNFNKTINTYFELKNMEDLKYDVIISGSDQLWNPNLTGDNLDPVFFCCFGNNSNICAAYAASIGEKHIDLKYYKKIKEYLENFKFISVREEGTIKELKNFTKKQIQQVLDPTLLLQEKDYKKIATKREIEEDYILIYQNSKDNLVYRIVKKIAKEKKLKIVEICYRTPIFKNNQRNILDAGPKEFLSLYANAKFVVTNTFHGTVFAIIFKKNFISIPLKGRESRVESLMNILNLNRRLIYNYDENKIIELAKEKINYNMVECLLAKERKNSINFLKKFVD